MSENNIENKKIIFIVGPTAAGKTDVAFSLAQKISGEIISCDSMQIYKQISIASSKPHEEMRDTVPHHLFDIISVEEDFDVGVFNKLALEAIGSIIGGGKVPIIVGGSGMYMQILLDGIFEVNEVDQDIRESLEKRAVEEGNGIIYDELKRVDPEAAAKIHPNDVRRIIRALEVFIATNKPISEFRKDREGLWNKCDVKIFALNRDRKELYSGIEQRVEEMFKGGLVEEIRNLSGLNISRTAGVIIGVPEVLGYLKGEYDIDRAKYLMKLNTRHFAKRQLTWFRKEKRIKWIMVQKNDSVEDVVETIMENLRGGIT